MSSATDLNERCRGSVQSKLYHWAFSMNFPICLRVQLSGLAIFMESCVFNLI